MGLWSDIRDAYIDRFDIVNDYKKFKMGEKVIHTSQDKYTLVTFCKKKALFLGENNRLETINNKENLQLLLNTFINTKKIYDFNLKEFINKYKVPNQYFVIGDEKFYIYGKNYYIIADNNDKMLSSEVEFFARILYNLHNIYDFKFEEHDIMTGYIS